MSGERREARRQARLHTARLRKLARILTEFTGIDFDPVEEEDGRVAEGLGFNMNHWAQHLGDHPLTNAAPICGTTACALGHAALDPGFRRAGLHLEWRPAIRDFDQGLPRQLATVHFHGYMGEDAGAEFFGLSQPEAYDVFYGTERTRSRVIQWLEDHAEDRKELTELGKG